MKNTIKLTNFANLWDQILALREAYKASNGDFDYKNEVELLLHQFAKANLVKASPFFYPQLLKEISTWPTPTTNGLIDPSKFVEANSDSYKQGIIQFCLTNSRWFSGTQYKEGKEYSAMVPLILAAHKKYRGVKYSEWMYAGLNKIVHPSLYVAMNPDLPTFTLDELLEARTFGLTTQTGKNAGQTKNSMSTYKLNVGRKDHNPNHFSNMPVLYQNMLAQIWCAHPACRTQYTVCSNKDWDNFPDPLIETNMEVSVERSVDNQVMPWD